MNKTKNQERAYQYYLKHKDKINARTRERYRNLSPGARQRILDYQKTWYYNNKLTKKSKEKYKKLENIRKNIK